jgi:predicted peptidase
VVLVLAGAAGPRADEPPREPGVYERWVTTARGEELRYTISIPVALPARGPLPLVVALHYAGVVTPFYGKTVLVRLVEPALRELGAIVVAPDCPGEDWMDPGSEAMVLALLRHIRRVYDIDARRVLVTGYSMGGVGSWYLAAKHPDIFSAALPVAGVPPPGAVERIGRVPLYVIHGRGDEVFPLWRSEKAVERLRAGGADVHLEVLEGAGHYDLPRFVEPLRGAVPWIKKVWGD